MKVSQVALPLILSSMMLDVVHAVDVVARAMTFNVRTSYASVDEAAKCSNWRGQRKDNVIAQIKVLDPDFVGTQETSEEQRGFLDGNLKETYLSIGESSQSLGGSAPELNMIYYKHQSWKLLTNGMFWLGPNPDTPSADWGMKYFRTCVYGRFQHIESGQTVCVLNTHFETPGNDLAQTKGAEIILGRMKTICDTADKLTVLMGDLNAMKSYPAVQLLMSNGLNELIDDGTFCGDMIQPICQAKFDYTMHKLAGGACHLKTEVVRQNFDGCYPSDHAVQVASFCVSGGCCGNPILDQTSTQAPPDNALENSSNAEHETALPTPSPTASASEEASEEAARDADSINDSVLSKLSGVSGSKNDTGTSDIMKASTKSSTSSRSGGTVAIVIGIFGAVGVVCAVVIRRKRALDMSTQQSKSNFMFASIPNVFVMKTDEIKRKLFPAPEILRASSPAMLPMEEPSSDASSTRYSHYSESIVSDISDYSTRTSSDNFAIL